MRSKMKFKSKALLVVLILLIIGTLKFSCLNTRTEQVEQDLFQPLKERFEEAQKKHVNFFAPQNYARAFQAYETAKNDFKEGSELSVIKAKIREANEFLNRAFDATRISKVAFEDIVETRKRVLEFGYDKYYPDEIDKSERFLQKAIEKAEEGDIGSANSEKEKIYEQYRLATIKWLKDHVLEDTEKDIKKSHGSIDQENYERSLNKLKQLKQYIDKYEKEEFDLFELRNNVLGRAKYIEKLIYPPFFQNLPDKLLIADFVLIVDSYSDKGDWDFAQKRALGLSGTAWTNFNCDGLFLIPLLQEGFLKTIKVYDVVQRVYDEYNQISLREARLIQPNIQPGQILEVDLAVKQLNPQDFFKAKNDLIAKLELIKKGMILVHFDKVDIDPVVGQQNVGRIIKGMASYPTQSPIPQVIKLSVSGFTVLIDTLTLTVTGAVADIDLEFPEAIVSEDCKPATLNLGSTSINSECEFYVEKPDSSYGPFGLLDVGMKIKGKGFVADFSTTASYAKLAKPQAIGWKGVNLLSGQTIPGYNNTVISNIGYLYANYVFKEAKVSFEGFDGLLKLNSPFQFSTLIPSGFEVNLNKGSISINKNMVVKGNFDGKVLLTENLTTPSGDRIEATFASLSCDSTLSLSGKVNLIDTIHWGRFGISCKNASLFLPAEPCSVILPYKGNSFNSDYFSTSALDSLPGILFYPDTLIIDSEDMKSPLKLPFHDPNYNITGWLWAESEGITGEVLRYAEAPEMALKKELGVVWKGYKAKAPFDATIDSLAIQFVRNATFDSDLRGSLDIPYPCEIKPPFRDLKVTSTADLVGGNLKFEKFDIIEHIPFTLKYWGLSLESRRGVLCVRIGEIIFTDADILEKEHFSEPFHVIWGEMLADGNLGDFVFDYNSGNQRFDGFPFLIHKAELSKYGPSSPKWGHIRAYGDISFNFFGTKRMDIIDTKDPSHKTGRWVNLDKKNCDLDLKKQWGMGTADMDFIIGYDEADQDGFNGNGLVTINIFVTELNKLKASIDLNSVSIGIGYCGKGSSATVFQGPPYPIKLSKIGGCMQIFGDDLKKVFFEGSIEKTGLLDVSSAVNVEITPSVTTLGTFSNVDLSIGPVGLGGKAAFKLVFDKTKKSLNGDIRGAFSISQYAAGAKGQFSFYVAPVSSYIQGEGKIYYFGWGPNMAVTGGFFAGYNAPINQIWILGRIHRGPNIKEILKNNNMTVLTGAYVNGMLEYGFNWYLIEGKIGFWGGFGTFEGGNPKQFWVIGHGGAELSGSVLYGALSLSAGIDLSTVVGAPLEFKSLPVFCMDGTLFIDACCCWDIICFNKEVSFHFGTSGIGKGRCN